MLLYQCLVFSLTCVLGKSASGLFWCRGFGGIKFRLEHAILPWLDRVGGMSVLDSRSALSLHHPL
jgi:hypothetical protein